MREQLHETHGNCRQLVAQLLSECLVGIEVELSKCILHISDQRVLLKHLNVVFDHLSGVKLTFLALLLVLVRILGVLVERVVRVAVDADLEHIPFFLVRAGSGDCIF